MESGARYEYFSSNDSNGSGDWSILSFFSSIFSASFVSTDHHHHHHHYHHGHNQYNQYNDYNQYQYPQGAHEEVNFFAQYDQTHEDYHAQRQLAGPEYRRPLDYSILAVGIITLGLLIIAEIVKHHLDVAAKGRPFFHSVLDGVKEELSTLGIVELIIFLLVKYYKDLNVPRELVFADVHFTLFYTAIFNAFQSVFLAFASWRVSNKLWVQTESLEIDHYVEIREEFERLHSRLYPADDASTDSDIKRMTTTRRNMVENNRKYFTAFDYTCSGIREALRNVWMNIRYPMEVAKYNQLLIQVRFHQLRIHFLESNGLPLTLKVSDYLKKAESTVLIKLVHISTVAWLLLIGALNLMYYILGMVVYESEDPEMIGIVMKTVFFAALVGFIIISLIVYNKMKSIFSVIINWKRPGMSMREEEEQYHKQQQRDLFWQGDPHLVIALIQVMQFGYAICLAFLLIYWQNLAKEAAIEWYYFLISVLSCYAVFCFIMGKVIPQYTLCTSMGHLIRTKHLQQTLAQHELAKAQREQQRKKLLRAILQQQEGELMLQDGRGGVMFCSSTNAAAENTVAGTNSAAGGYQDDMTIETRASFGSRAQRARPLTKSLSADRKTGAIFQMQQMQDESDKTQLLAKLVKTDTDALRSRLPEEERNILQTRQERARARRRNRKTVSDGVAMMRTMGTPSFLQSRTASTNSSSFDSDNGRTANGLGSVDEHNDDNFFGSAPRTKASHLDRADMGNRAFDDSALDRLNKAGASDTPAAIAAVHGARGTRPATRADRKAARRASRHKAVSASAIIQSWRDHSVQDTGLPGGLGPLQEEHHSDHEDDPMHDANADLEGNDDVTDRSGINSNNADNDANERIVDMVPVGSGKKQNNANIDKAANNTIGKNDDVDDNASDERASMDSGKSVGELSEVDVDVDMVVSSTASDVPNVRFEYVQRTWRDKMSDLMSQLSPALIRMRLRRYFMGKRYATISHVFGSVVVYYLIGNRIESFLALEKILDNSDQTWELRIGVSFWWESVWYIFFIIASLIVLGLMRFKTTSPKSERIAVIAAAIDLILSSTCLAILVYAESERCCEGGDSSYNGASGYESGSDKAETTPSSYLEGDPSYRRLAGDYDKGDDDYDPYLHNLYDPIYLCVCRAWGVRTYGGLGHIEPYTGLIALRVFRFMIARLIVDWTNSGEQRQEDTSVEDSETKNGAHISNSLNHVKTERSPFRELLLGADSERTAMTEERGSALELWHKAVMKYPDIVAKHGEFSGELFRAMLGLELEDPKLSSGPILNDISGRGSEDNRPSKGDEQPHLISNLDGTGAAKNAGSGAAAASAAPAQRLKLIGSRYAQLPVESQGIIIAGKLGKPVKSCVGTVSLLDPTPPKHADGMPRIVKPLEFEVDLERLAYEAAGEDEFSTYVAPSARIVRSMRRCDRRLLPLLDTWVPVDVIMTQFEIVYLEVSDDQAMSNNMDAALQALQATKGGKGLRLCDITRGRKIVGHMNLSEISEVHVERDMPIDDISDLSEHFDFDFMGAEPRVEFWEKTANNKNINSDASQKDVDEVLASALQPVDVTPSMPRHLRWHKIKEDRLKLVSEQGTLLLRFYTDLEDVEHHLDRMVEENEKQGHLTKNIAFQWAQTICRICGKSQLKESLPHFGNDDSEELRDYLEVVHHDKPSRRGSVFGHIEPLPKASNYRSSSAGMSPSSGHRRAYLKSTSMGSDHGDSKRLLASPGKPKAMFRRSQSIESSTPITGATGHMKKKGGNVRSPRVTFERSLSSPSGTDHDAQRDDAATDTPKKEQHDQCGEQMIEIEFSDDLAEEEEEQAQSKDGVGDNGGIV